MQLLLKDLSYFFLKNSQRGSNDKVVVRVREPKQSFLCIQDAKENLGFIHINSVIWSQLFMLFDPQFPQMGLKKYHPHKVVQINDNKVVGQEKQQ